MTSNLLITSTAYLPPLSWYAQALKSGSWHWEAFENYQKGGYRNRCEIAGPNKIERLSIPLRRGKHQSTPIQEVRISYQTDWVRHHKLQIQAAYGRAPFFEFYAPEVFGILEQKHEYLWGLNWQLQTSILNWLQSGISFEHTTSFLSTYQPGNCDLRPKGSQVDIELPPYPQLFQDRHGFQADLSILDLIFCQGPTAGLYLQKPVC